MIPRSLFNLSAFVLSGALLAGCSAVDRIENIGQAPALAPVGAGLSGDANRRVGMPMPQPERIVYEPNSLWRSGSRAFFRDQRASREGDILTVKIDIADSAKVDNTSKRSRDNSEDANLSNFFGLESNLSHVLPDAVDPTNLVGAGSTSSSTGTGSVNRQESIALTIAAVVTQTLPNGNLVIAGRQEVRVNNEVRELTVQGVVRPEDISNTNTIEHTQIAEARISYGGRGQITDVQQPRYGQQLYDILMPF
ncbi:flagellar L-ring protein precursor FlgH [Parvibaculum indicum]|uniref:flagellar basal body L-ring protein FlgH n=1 Tax=Parvibaculum indicum TaxID=562969 RepID=UPI001421E4E0|nr:flagellar basal body L-ring protein FlgH [Parvibaculum indicum]NIJ41139.1 flagellar L-ring protein precursor FlgH [Parvibaculum indicum]